MKSKLNYIIHTPMQCTVHYKLYIVAPLSSCYSVIIDVWPYLYTDHGQVSPDFRVFVVENVGLTQRLFCLLELAQTIACHAHSPPGEG